VVADDVSELAGAKHAEFLQRHLRHLREAYGHGNRKLFYDELVTAYLLAFFHPTARSLRAIEDLSQTWTPRSGADGQLKLRKLCRSTMSDANALMDARLLQPLIARLGSKVRQLKRQDGKLARLLEQVRVIDGSFFASAATVSWALKRRSGAGKRRAETPWHFKVRLDLHLCGPVGLPQGVSVNGKGSGEADSACQAGIEPGVIYIADRGLLSFKYIDQLLRRGGDFVLRAKQQLNFEPRQDQLLDPDDREAGVISDRIGQLSGSPHVHAAGTLPKQELREVIVFDPAHPDNPLRLITSLLDVPAHVIAHLYRWRWQIELFFRWLKVHAHFEHLITRSKNGMTLGFHVAVIAVLLIYLHTGAPMSKYAYNLLSLVASGSASVEAILPILERRERECQRERQRQAAKRAAKKNV
jgi:hypothetical protein